MVIICWKYFVFYKMYFAEIILCMELQPSVLVLATGKKFGVFEAATS
jgi:hypothetical protein